MQKKILLDTQKGVTHKPVDYDDVRTSIGTRFGLSNEPGIGSVAEQLAIWESEMNCITDFQGILVTFDNRQQHAEFKQFKDRKNIRCLLWSDEWKEGKENVVVVDIKQKREAYVFINECRY